MRKALLLVLFALGASAGPWDASFSRVGQIASTSPTSANLAVTAGSYVKVQCDVAAYVGNGEGSGTACTATTCQKLAAGDLLFSRLMPRHDYVAALAVAGTATCQVFRAIGQ